MRRIAGGVAGWLAAVAPLLGVNIAGYANIIDSDTAVIAGASALLGGILLGGLIAGLIAGRPAASGDTSRASGAMGALPAGILAGLLYAVSLVSVVFVATQTDAAPAVVVEHPLRITGAIICLGAILVGISLLAGTLAGRRSGQAESARQAAPRYPVQASRQPMARQPAPMQPRYEDHASQPAQAARNADSYTGNEGYEGYRESSGRHDYQGYPNSREQRDRGGHGQGYGYNGSSGSDRRSGQGDWQPAPQRGVTPSHSRPRHPSDPSQGDYGRYSRQDDGRREGW